MCSVNWPQLKGFRQFHFSSESCLMLQPDVAFHTKPLCCVSCQVTIFGESAGAQSVSLHLMIQSSKPLFKQAVLQSLPFSIPLKTRWGSDSHWWPLCDSFVPDWRCKILWNQKAVRSIFLRGGGCGLLSSCCIQTRPTDFKLNCNFVFLRRLPRHDALKLGKGFAKQTNCSVSNIVCLLSLTPQAVLAAQMKTSRAPQTPAYARQI